MLDRLSKLLLMSGVIALLVFAATDVQAQVRFGPQVAWGSDTDLGIGARLTGDVDAFGGSDSSALRSLRGIAEFIYYLDPHDGCDECSALEINASGVVPIKLGESNNDFYAGGGLNLARFSVDIGGAGSVSNTEIGLNVLGGLNFALSNLAAFVEAGIRISGSEQFVISSGITFGGGGN